MQAAYESEISFRSGVVCTAWIAPVGQARTHSSHAVQRLKSITGKPNEARAPKGSASVSDPVLRL
jgi:hypothetical protein